MSKIVSPMLIAESARCRHTMDRANRRTVVSLLQDTLGYRRFFTYNSVNLTVELIKESSAGEV